jgi:hypothetical protein
VRRRLQTELATLPQPALSYEELLAFFIEFGITQVATLLNKDGLYGGASEDTRNAAQLAAELLPQLAPDSPYLRYTAAISASFNTSDFTAGRARYLTMLPAALDVALEQGSDVNLARCGYRMAVEIEDWVAESAVRQALPPPSTVLGWLQQGEAAHRRCKGLLPKQWTSVLDSAKAMAAPAKASLQHMQQQGDRWRRLTPAVQRELHAAHQDCRDEFNVPVNKHLTCSGCGRQAPQLRVCGACREAQYCR